MEEGGRKEYHFAVVVRTNSGAFWCSAISGVRIAGSAKTTHGGTMSCVICNSTHDFIDISFEGLSNKCVLVTSGYVSPMDELLLSFPIPCHSEVLSLFCDRASKWESLILPWF